MSSNDINWQKLFIESDLRQRECLFTGFTDLSIRVANIEASRKAEKEYADYKHNKLEETAEETKVESSETSHSTAKILMFGAALVTILGLISTIAGLVIYFI